VNHLKHSFVIEKR